MTAKEKLLFDLDRILEGCGPREEVTTELHKFIDEVAEKFGDLSDLIEDLETARETSDERESREAVMGLADDYTFEYK